MGKTTGISWTDATWNPWRGCLEVSPACAHCYAREWAKRNPAVFGVWGKEGHGTRVVAAESQWDAPVKWDRDAAKAGKPRRVFVASMADVFERWDGPMIDARGRVMYADTHDATRWFPAGEAVGRPRRPLTMDDARDRLHATMAATLNLTYLVLTKRPEVALAYYNAPGLRDRIAAHAPGWAIPDPTRAELWPNRHVGVTAENREQADARVPVLLNLPTVSPWVSYEPALGPVDWTNLTTVAGTRVNALSGVWTSHPGTPCEVSVKKRNVRQIIIGGESGSRAQARPFHPEWARDTIRQCRRHGVAPFVKQLGTRPFWSSDDTFDGGVAAHGPGASKWDDPAEWPADLRVREHPDTHGATA